MNKKLIFHLLSLLDQHCYTSFEDDVTYRSNFNPDANAIGFLVKKGYLKYLSEPHWPETRYFDFTFTEKGKKLLKKNYN
jgi:hypothetical protein